LKRRVHPSAALLLCDRTPAPARRKAETSPRLGGWSLDEEDHMRSNSGKDEARNNMHDPTTRDRELGRGDTATTSPKPKAPADHRTGRKD
jgi:hypothetical protein